MYWFRNYRELLESKLIDQFISETIISRQILPLLASLLFWSSTNNLFSFMLPLLSIYLRRKIDSSTYFEPALSLWDRILLFLFLYYTDDLLFFLPLLPIYLRGRVEALVYRRLLTHFTLAFSLLGRTYFWTIFLISTELVRTGLIYGVPFFLRRVSEEMPRDPIGETAFKRSVRLLRRLKTIPVGTAMSEYLTIYQQYQRQDVTEPFTKEEQEQFRRFFQEFSRTSLVVGESIVFFFPSFTVRIDSTGMNFDSESALKLIESDQSADDCPICRDTSSGPWAELRCQHRYCLQCIVQWLREKGDCPLCRNPVS